MSTWREVRNFACTGIAIAKIVVGNEPLQLLK